MHKQYIKINALIIFATVGFLGMNEASLAADPPIKASGTEKGGMVIKGKGNIDILKTAKTGKKNFTAETQFNFHPSQNQRVEKNTLNFKTKKFDSSAFTLDYTEEEEHGTNGSSDYKLSVAVIEKDKGELKISAGVTVTISPGKTNPPRPVSVLARIVDPLSFSDTDPFSTFSALPEGIVISPFLDAGFGMEIDPTKTSQVQFNMSANVLVGSITDPDYFATQVTGLLPLYALTIRSRFDSILNKEVVDADLGFNLSDEFDVDFLNEFGILIDKDDFGEIARIESIIESAFVLRDGFLGLTEILTPFAVIIQPSALISEYTVGQQGEALISSIEVEEPPTYLLVFLGSILMFALKIEKNRAIERQGLFTRKS